MMKVCDELIMIKMIISIYIFTESSQINYSSKTTWFIILLIFCGMVFSVTMIVVGSLHADRDFTDSLKPGVIHTNCSLIEFCGG